MTRILAAAVVAAGGLVVARRLATRRRSVAPVADRRWHSLTVYRTLDEVGANLPDRLRALEVQLRSAPGGRGTELRVRAAGAGLPAGEVERILRLSRSLLEVGEVLR
jgi:hypothetical protein